MHHDPQNTRVEDTPADTPRPRRRRALRLLTVIGAMSVAVTFAGQSAAQAAPADWSGGRSGGWSGGSSGGWGGAAPAPAPAPAPTPAPAPAPAPAPVAATGSVQAYKDYALAKLGGDTTQFSCLNQLWQAESGWNPNAQNPTSSAYGIPQFLDATWAGTGIAKTSDPYRQIDAGLIYIKNRYGSPCAAWAFHQANNWY
jgi:hypothetical protein